MDSSGKTAMTITIHLSPATGDRLRDQATALGCDAGVYAAELIERSIAATEAVPGGLSPAQRAAEWRAWAESHTRSDHFVNDSRDSIYDSRGE